MGDEPAIEGEHRVELVRLEGRAADLRPREDLVPGDRVRPLAGVRPPVAALSSLHRAHTYAPHQEGARTF